MMKIRIRIFSLHCPFPSELALNYPSQMRFLAQPSHQMLRCIPLNNSRYFLLGNTNKCFENLAMESQWYHQSPKIETSLYLEWIFRDTTLTYFGFLDKYGISSYTHDTHFSEGRLEGQAVPWLWPVCQHFHHFSPQGTGRISRLSCGLNLLSFPMNSQTVSSRQASDLFEQSLHLGFQDCFSKAILMF